MLDLIKRFELIQKRQVSQYMSGSVECIFEYNEKCGKNEDGTIPVIIKPDPVETKKKKNL